MNCPSCGHENRAGAKFCEECATPLRLACSNCGSELRPTAKFCDECATPVAGAAAPAPRAAVADGARKVVTIVFADLVGSTSLHERLDPESARRFMEGYYAATRRAVEEQNGKVTQLLGDGVKAVFGIPRVAEDDAIRAVRAAVGMQEAFRELADAQRGAVGTTGLRVAVNTGEVVAKDETEIIGDPVNVAARLQEQGRDGDVVVGDSTAQLVSSLVTLEPLGSFALKGRAEEVAAYRVVSLDSPDDAATAAFVGRDEELARIMAVYEQAVEKPAAALAVLLGSPGLGKSRLIEEFSRRLGDAATIATATCVEASGASFAPLASALREVLGLEAGSSTAEVRAAVTQAVVGDDAERARVADGIEALLAASPAAPEETFFVVRRLLTGLAADKPVVLVIDDLQWAEPLLLDLVEHLVQWGTDVPLLVLIGARPELRDHRSALVIPGGLVSDVLTLGGLDAQAAMQLAANVIGAVDLPAAVAAKVLASSEGNPLYVRELVRMLVHEGALVQEGDRWVPGAGLEQLEMPPTIHALLAARIERLQPEERSVLERAAVVGRHFSRGALGALLPTDAGDLDARLESLLRGELIERDAGWLLGEPRLRFHHVLIRDAAYRRILKGTRAELHERFADWVESHAADPVEHDETIGWHLEQAHQHRLELGPLDAAGRALGERASKHLAAAGRRALARDDVSLAASLLGRALERLDAGDSARAELALDWCEALLAAGDVGPAAAAIEELGRFAGESDRLRAWHTCFIGQHTVLTAPEDLDATADAVAAAATSLASQGDGAGEAKAHFVHALALQRLGKVGACEAALDQALAAARRAEDRRRANTVLAIAPLAALWGPSPVTRASGRCLDVVRVLRISQSAPAVEAVALSCQGVLEALRGRTDAARRMIASAREMVEELGITHRLLEADVFAGRVELIDGDAAAAERWLRGAYEGLRDAGLGIDAAQAAALLARALLGQDRVDEAETLSHESEALAGDDLAAAIAWRGVRAEALAQRGEHAGAVEFASKAVEIASATDALLDHADARVALAAALRAAGRDREAEAEERRARELWESKGASLLSEQAPRVERSAAPAPAHSQRTPSATLRRVRPNRATASIERFVESFAAGDGAALGELFADDLREIDHPTGSVLGAADTTASIQRLLRSHDPVFRMDPLATLGSSLALSRRRTRASGTGGGRFDVGEYENEVLHLLEVNAEGRFCWAEVFAPDALDEAIARLYERHAEIAPDGAEQKVADGGHSISEFLIAAELVAEDEARIRSVLAPNFQSVDQRQLSTWTSSGAEAFLQAMHALLGVADDVSLRSREVLALDRRACLVRRTNTGVDHRGGGAYEREFLLLIATGDDGLLSRAEWFDVGRQGEALARLDALAAGADRTSDIRRRVRPNTATRNAERQLAALRASDVDALMACMAEDVISIHHAWGRTLEPSEIAESFRWIFEARNPVWSQESLATLGDSLALIRRTNSSEGGDDGESGEAELDVFILLEAGERGLLARSEVFGAERLNNAIASLYGRYAESLPDGAAKTCAAVMVGQFPEDERVLSPDRLETACHPDVEMNDHRLVGSGLVRGIEAVKQVGRSLEDATEDRRWRIDDILALSDEAYVIRTTNSGTMLSGGAFERETLAVTRHDEKGLITHWELYDPDHEAEALARFDQLSGSGASTSPFANAATRLNERFAAAWIARDWDAVSSLHHERCDFDDRRPLMQRQSDLDETARTLFEVPNGRWKITPLATRGERLALSHVVFEGDVPEGGGELAIDYLNIDELDDRGELGAVVMFGPSDAEAAYAELDRRFEAEEAAEHPLALATTVAVARAYHERDWDVFAARAAPGFAQRDHRRLVWAAEARDLANFIEMIRSLPDLAPDIELQVENVRICERGVLRQFRQQGTHDGSAFESVIILVWEIDEQGRILRWDTYDEEQASEALARFAEIAASRGGSGPFENHATRAFALGTAAVEARDWEGFSALFRDDFRSFDRVVHLEAGREEWLAAFREMIEITSSSTRELLATRGEHLGLFRHLWRGAQDDVGPSEVDWLTIIEADEQSMHRVVVTLRYPDDLDAAYAELDERFAAGDGAAYPHAVTWLADLMRTFAARDWDAMESLFAPELVSQNHRLVGWGTRQGPSGVVSTMQAQVELAPDTRARFDHVRLAERGVILQWAWHGTREGGAFENLWLDTYELDAAGKVRRVDVWEPEQFDVALAHFAEIRDGGHERARLTSAAIRMHERMVAGWRGSDWQGFLDCTSASFRFSDRRPMLQVELDRDQWVVYAREFGGERRSGRLEPEILATRGDRLCLARIRQEVERGDVGPSEIEFLDLSEVDDEGRLLELVRFAPEALDAATAELEARWEEGEATTHPRTSAWVASLFRCIAARDWDALAALATPEQVSINHRLVGWGTVTGAEAWARAFREMVELAPDAQLRLDHLRTCERGCLLVVTWVGTREGGAFEIPMAVATGLNDDGLQVRTDVWDGDPLDAALARFAEMSAADQPGSTEPLGNAAFRTSLRLARVLADRDWEGFVRQLSMGFRNLDRRRHMQIELEREPFLEGFRQIVEMTTGEPSQELLATRGEQLALVRVLWQGAGGNIGPTELDWLLVLELDARGEACLIATFDPGDLETAYGELDARWEASEAAVHPQASGWVRAFRRAFADRDWEAFRALEAPGQVAHNHRLVGWGTLRGEGAWLRTLQELTDLAPDVRMRVDHLRTAGRALLCVFSWQGTQHGGAFETPLVMAVELSRAGLQTRIDVWDADMLDVAIARFGEIAARGPEPFANAASRAFGRVLETWRAHDVDAWAEIQQPGVRYRDHRPLYQLDLNRAEFLEFARPLIEMPASSVSTEMIATRGDRLALLGMVMAVEGEEVGPSATGSLVLIEADAEAYCAYYDRYEVADLERAYAELDGRWTESEASSQSAGASWAADYRRCFRERDWQGFRQIVAPDGIAQDHRRTVSWGAASMSRGTEALEALVELAPDLRQRVDHLRVSDRAAVWQQAWVGTREGGPFEIPVVILGTLNEEGVATRVDVYDVDMLDEALERFDGAGIQQETQAFLGPNAVADVMERWVEAYDQCAASDDWDALLAFHAPDFVFDDRRRIALLSGGADLMIASARERAASGASIELRTIGVFGERVQMTRNLWSGGPADGRFEIEYLSLVEIREDGALSAFVFFDEEDAREAQREAWTRWAAIDPRAERATHLIGEGIDAFNAQDAARCRVRLADDYTVDDHRLAGVGRIEGADSYMESLVALWELAPQTRLEGGWHWPALGERSFVTAAKRSGAVPGGGGEFESPFLQVVTHENGLFTHMDLFEVADLDAALARFEEIEAAGHSVSSGLPRQNLASEAREETVRAFNARDMDALLDLISPDVVWEDRQRHVQLTGNRETWERSVRERWEAGTFFQAYEIEAIAGERVAILRSDWSGGPSEGRFEVSTLAVLEVDEAGQVVAVIIFGVDQRREAQREAWRRWAGIDPSIETPTRIMGEMLDAFAEHDRARFRAVYHDDCIAEDHRHAGMGRLEGADAYVDTITTLWELAPDSTAEGGWPWVEVVPHGFLLPLRRIGRLAEGGEYESENLNLYLLRDDRIARAEFFEKNDLEAARERLEALAPAAG